MNKNILAINLGSSSKKYSVFIGEEKIFYAHFEKTDSGFELTYNNGEPIKIDEKKYNNSLSEVIERTKKHNFQISAVGIRIVAIGKQFASHSIIDSKYLKSLSKESERDPAHIPLVIKELAELNRLLPKIPVVAASDSAFHSTMPSVARRYAIPSKSAEPNEIEHSGFHGLSFASAVSQLKKLLGKIPERTIVCHMGNGTSIAALLNGKSIETSMGYSPLSGVPMSTRVGDIDPEAVLRLVEKNNVEKVRKMLYDKSGLLALSGRSGDMRTLLESAKEGDKNSDFAIESFAYHIKLFIGAYIAALGGLDAIVFSGTIGVRSASVRNRATEGLSHFGIVIDSDKNEKAKPNDDIAAARSSVKIFVLKTDEEKEIVKAVRKVI